MEESYIGQSHLKFLFECYSDYEQGGIKLDKYLDDHPEILDNEKDKKSKPYTEFREFIRQFIRQSRYPKNDYQFIKICIIANVKIALFKLTRIDANSVNNMSYNDFFKLNQKILDKNKESICELIGFVDGTLYCWGKRRDEYLHLFCRYYRQICITGIPEL